MDESFKIRSVSHLSYFKHSLVLLVFFFFYFSCQREDHNNNPRFILAGVKNGDIRCNNIGLSINASEFSCLHYYGKDSFDVTFDNVPDIKLIINHRSPDIFGKCCINTTGDCVGETYGYRQIWLEVKNLSFECATESSSLIKQLSPGDTISFKLNWQKQTKYYFDNFAYPSSFDGIWTDVNDKYMGFRIVQSDTLYGWIKLSTGFTSYTIKDFGILK